MSGIGGQGLIVCGTILSKAATIYEGRNATLTSSYGVETRGTFTKSDVVISDDTINYPEVVKSDIVLSLAPVAYDEYVSKLDEDSILVYDSSLVKDIKESEAKQYGYPITDIALELGNVKTANIIAIGIIIKKTGVVSIEAVIKVIKDQFAGKPQKVIDLNIKALNMGLELA